MLFAVCNCCLSSRAEPEVAPITVALFFSPLPVAGCPSPRPPPAFTCGALRCLHCCCLPAKGVSWISIKALRKKFRKIMKNNETFCIENFALKPYFSDYKQSTSLSFSQCRYCWSFNGCPEWGGAGAKRKGVCVCGWGVCLRCCVCWLLGCCQCRRRLARVLAKTVEGWWGGAARGIEGRNMKMQCARNENIKNLIAIIQAHKMLMECM